MNNVFQKNISALSQKNATLAQKLLSFVPSDIPKLVQENGMYNYFYRGQYIHNPQNPIAEAKEIFSMATNEPVAIHLVYGLGLGYLFQVTCNSSNGTVILYEPDLNILFTSFTLVDFSNDILKSNVHVASTFEDASMEIYKKSNTKNFPQMLSLPSASEYNKENFYELVQKLQAAVGSYALDLKYTKQILYPSLTMLIKNIPNIFKEIPLAKFKDSLRGKTAVIASAGPTLDRNIDTLKKNRDKFVLFTVGTAVKTLYKNGLKPDFLCIIETYNSSRQVEGLDLCDVNFITEPYSNPELRNVKFKNIYSHISANSPINLFWSEICGENIEEYWSKGTVSYTAINSARLLGCSKIILVGQDLAYIEGQCYSKDSAYKDLICKKNSATGKWEITAKDFEAFANAISNSADPEERKKVANTRLVRLNNSLYYVKGINGDMIPTESVYAAFVNPLSDFAKHFNDRTYINTSLVGAQIDGYENLPLEDALKNSETIGEVSLVSNFEYDRKKIINNLKNKLSELKTAQSSIKEGLQLVDNVFKNIKRRNTVDKDVLKALKNLSLLYLNLSGDFSNKSAMFNFITIDNKIDLDYEMKMMKDFSKENVTNICEKLKKYFNDASERINYIEMEANESINSAG